MYYFRVSKNGKKNYNFDDPAGFFDATAKAHMVADQPNGARHGVPLNYADMQGVDHEDGQGSRAGAEFGN